MNFARSRTSMNCRSALGGPGVNYFTTLRNSPRPIGEAVCGVIGAHDQAWPDDDQIPFEILLDLIFTECFEGAIGCAGIVLVCGILQLCQG